MNGLKKDDKIVILGVTGYMGSWLAKSLSDAGYTNILGTYRNETKMSYLTDQLPHVTGIKADLLDSPDQVMQALEGSQWVFNDSAPFTGNEKNVDDLVKTKQLVVDNLFKAILNTGSVKKLIHIGSGAAIGFGNTDPNKRVINEDDWTNLEDLDYPYESFMVMKTKEEQRVWELANVAQLPVTILHPMNVVGPSFMPWNHDMTYSYLHGSKYLVNGNMENVDVRDIAGLQMALMQNPDADGKHVLGIGFTINYQELEDVTRATLTADQIHELFGDLPEIVAPELALDLWKSVSYTSFYKDQAYRLINHTIVKTKYPEFYQYAYTDVEKSIKPALVKMYADLQK